ncbi:MAG: DUF2357 domain-containing protein, partial [Lentisphaeraceae bacterium]|nr:DUF2357 domain-containing protein [Lentisphaeraceae bacterium]
MTDERSLLFNKAKQRLKVYASQNESDLVLSESGELQLIEGRRYEYELEKGFSLKAVKGIVSVNRKGNEGLIEPGIFVGLLKLVLLDAEGREIDRGFIEVRSVKINYAEEYRAMLEDITDKTTDLLMQLDSPVEQSYNPQETQDEATLVQRFYFLKGLIGGVDFREAVHRVIHNPNTHWLEDIRQKPLSSCSRLGRFEVRQVASAKRRQEVPQGHSLHGAFQTLPEVISVRDKRDCVDTAENRFVKHVLTVFEMTVEDIFSRLQKLLKEKSGDVRYPGVLAEAEQLVVY